MKRLIHHGILTPAPPEYKGQSIQINGVKVKLTPSQEEMAYAWAKKQGTPYVEDPVFIRNFMTDFCRALGLPKTISVNDIDFSELNQRVEQERVAREALSTEERKALAAQRKATREELKAFYGYAIADDERIELATYMAEPSGIFMGRGKHPLRGRWKAGATKKEITLNLSPDAKIDRDEWNQVCWQPESLWVARWEDKLSGKLKYIWLHDTAPIKQTREAQKFNKATELDSRLETVQQHIEEGLRSDNAKIRKIATACTLIDKLCLRVGDEKDPDEADTVGATTLRPEHIKFLENSWVEFRFLGKDSVLWHKKIELPDVVIQNLKELSRTARPSTTGKSTRKHPIYSKPQLFPDVSSRDVNSFLSAAMPGLSAKVFRTHHATAVVKMSLDETLIEAEHPEFVKWEAVTKANTRAAILCNHTRQAPKNWNERKSKYRTREKQLTESLASIRAEMKKTAEAIRALKKESTEKRKRAAGKEQRKKAKMQYEKKVKTLNDRLANLERREEKATISLGKLRAQMSVAMENRSWNLTTSQKSYIDPRVFYNWGLKRDYNVLEKYYSTTLRNKFQWVKDPALNPGLPLEILSDGDDSEM